MGYFMRFIVTDEKKVSLTKLEADLKKIDEKYSIEKNEGDETEGTLLNSGEVYCEIDINTLGDGLFDEEIEELAEFLDDAEEGVNKKKVFDVLKNAKTIFCIRVLNQGRNEETTFKKIDPVWDWFFENYTGLMQADMEGYYDASKELILEVE
jgi:hypothetical protein